MTDIVLDLQKNALEVFKEAEAEAEEATRNVKRALKEERDAHQRAAIAEAQLGDVLCKKAEKKLY